MRIKVCARHDVEERNLQGDALISICGPLDSDPVIEPSDFPLGILPLRFDDVPVPELLMTHNGKDVLWKGPTADHIDQAISFAREIRGRKSDPLIVVHCLQGKSRSAAVALTILAEYLGEGREVEVANLLLDADIEARMCFNPGIVRLADDRLNGTGNLEAALESLCGRFVTWRLYWGRKRVIDLKEDKALKL